MVIEKMVLSASVNDGLGEWCFVFWFWFWCSGTVELGGRAFFTSNDTCLSILLALSGFGQERR